MARENENNNQATAEEPVVENENKKMSLGKKALIVAGALGVAAGAFFGIRALVNRKKNNG